MDYDVTFYDTVGSGYANPLGGSEFALVKLAGLLAAKGYRVAVVCQDPNTGPGPVDYFSDESVAALSGWSSRALVIMRYSGTPANLSAERVIVWAHDVGEEHYRHLGSLLIANSGDGNTYPAGATMVCVSGWQASQFPRAWRKTVIPPMIEAAVYDCGLKSHNRNMKHFLYASGAAKGLKETINLWQKLTRLWRGKKGWDGLHLDVTVPYGDWRSLVVDDANISFYDTPMSPVVVAQRLAGSAGLFYANVFPETFCNLAAVAEAAGARCHILTLGNPGGLPEAIRSPLLTGDASKFEHDFNDALLNPQKYVAKPRDLRPETILPRWEKLLGLRDVEPPRTKRKATVCLTMIAKDAEKTIGRAIESAKPFVDCIAVLIDSGESSNATEKTIVDNQDAAAISVLARTDKRGDLAELRNDALKLAERTGADYALILDADDILEAEPWFEFDPTRDKYDLPVRDSGTEYRRTHLFRLNKGFRYEGPAHEVLCDPPNITSQNLYGLTYVRQTAGSSRAKYEQDAEVLSKTAMSNPRSLYYYAQSLMDAGKTDAAISAFKSRAAMSEGFHEEAFESCMHIARLLIARLRTPPAVTLEEHLEDIHYAHMWYMSATRVCPERAVEALTELANLFRDCKMWGPAYAYASWGRAVNKGPAGRLFVRRDAYLWRITDEFILAAYYIGRRDEAQKACEELLASPNLPASDRPRIEDALSWAKGIPPKPKTSPELIGAEWDVDERSRTILEQLRANLLAQSRWSATATEQWRARILALAEKAKTEPLDQFLAWTQDLHISTAMAIFRVWYLDLKIDPQWSDRWLRLSRSKPYGRPATFFMDGGTTQVTLRHAHHLMTFEREAGIRFLEDIDVVVEIGGGYGNFARMMREDGFRGTYYIIDLPHTREFQRAYLHLCEIPASNTPGPIDGVCLMVEKDIPEIIRQVSGKRVALVATWSLSETPLAFRDKVLPIIRASSRAIITSQWPEFEGINNERYFTELTAHRHHLIKPVMEMPSSKYVFLFDRVTPLRPMVAPDGAPFYIPDEPSQTRWSCELLAKLVFQGEYEASELPKLSSPNILDIGANIGAFATWARYKWPNARIIGYEPNPSPATFFKKNAPGAEIHVAAVTIDPKPFLAIREDWGMSYVPSAWGTAPGADAIEVSAEHPRNLPPCDVLKIDAEGVEPEILENYPYLGEIKVCLYEYHSKAHRDRCRSACEKAGLRHVSHKACHENENQGTDIWVRLPAGMVPLTKMKVPGGADFFVPESPPRTRDTAEQICESVFGGEYESPNLPDEPNIILDIGANIGCFAVWAHDRWPGASLLCYEPNAEASRICEINAPFARVLSAAVTTAKEPELTVYYDWSMSHTRPVDAADVDYWRTQTPSSGTVKVPAIHPRDLPPCDILKLDAEGVEPEILENYQHLSTVKYCVYEYHSEKHRVLCEATCVRAGLRRVSQKAYKENLGVEIWIR